ncbi:MAG: hypothetical protein HKO81_04740 [Flavobacteriaceae bacterium]|nr:hypothetical protein [Flavobacteriaceae bacterium]
MKYLRELLVDIADLAITIENHYPELNQFLDERTFLIPSTDHPDINIEIVQDYLASLKQLLKHQLEVYQTQKGSNYGRNCHIKQTNSLIL